MCHMHEMCSEAQSGWIPESKAMRVVSCHVSVGKELGLSVREVNGLNH